MVAAGSQYEAGVVLHVLAADLLRALHGQLHGVAQLPNTQLPAFQSFADDVDGRVILFLFRYKRYLRAGNHERNREIIVGVVLPEIRCSGIKRHVDPRQLCVQLVHQLLLAVGAVQVFEIPSRVVTRAKIEFQVGAVDLHFQPAESSVLQRIIARKAEHVICGTVLLNLGKYAAEIIRIEKRLAARVRRKGCQRFLRSGVSTQIVQHGLARISRLPVQAGRLCFSSRREGLQAADIQRIDRYVGFHRRRGRGAQRRLVVRPRLADSVAEIDEALFLREFAKRLHQRLQRQELAVGVEGVEIGVVRGKRSARFCRPLRASRAAVFEALALSGMECGQRRQQFGLVIREIQVHTHVRGQRHERHQIGGLHLGINEFLRRIDGAVNLFRIHGRKIKKEQNQSPVARVQRRLGLLSSTEQRPPGNTRYGRLRRAGGCQFVYILEIESGNLLLFPILQEREISFFQVPNEVPLLVVRDDIHQHEFARNLNACLIDSRLSALLGYHRRCRL